MEVSVIDFIDNSKYLSLHKNNLLDFLIDLTPVIPSSNHIVVLNAFNRRIEVN